MTLDRYRQSLTGDLAGVADASGKAIESVAVALGYSELDYAKPRGRGNIRS
jgi:hypothetical protein